MKVHEIVVGELLQGSRKQYRVPLYQRPFSWVRDNLERLWEDILAQAGEITSGDRDLPTHFLGAVVFAPTHMNAVGNSDHLVVDGQQRLTALTLVLAAIRDRYADVEGNERARDRINDYYLADRHGEGDGQLRLLPTQTDRDAYRAIILGREPHDPDRHQLSSIVATYDYFADRLKENERSEESFGLSQIEQAVTGRLALVSITVDGNENPHRIYETLNNTGLKLSQADLVRNYLFMKLEGAAEEVYQRHWLPIQERLAKSAPESFTKDRKIDPLGRLLWLQLVLHGEEKTRMEDLYSAQTRWFARSGDAKPQIKSYVTEIHTRSGLYQKILEPHRESHPEVGRRLSRLAQWDAWVAEPTTLFFLDQRNKGLITDEACAEALNLIESFLVRRAIAGIPTHGLNRIFQRLPKELTAEATTGGDSVAALLRRFSVDKNRWPTNTALRELMRTVPFYQTVTGVKGKFVLGALEDFFAHPEAVDLNRPKFTVEHILPQSPAAEWWAVIDEDAKSAEPPVGPQDMHRSLVHLIGNLTLTAENQQLSNHPFERKQQIFARSHLEMNREIADKRRWGRAEIMARCDELAERAIGIWPGPATFRWQGR